MSHPPLLEGFVRHELPDGCAFFTGALPAALVTDEAAFERLWSLHPEQYHVIRMVGRRVATPRWQQAYGADYHYSGSVNVARPLPPVLLPYLAWTQRAIEPALNALLLNWYDGALQHHIGAHRDSTEGLVPDMPIVTISLGSERSFCLIQGPRTALLRLEFPTSNGSVFVVPWATNAAWRHTVPHRAEDGGCRISLTVRAFLRD